MKDHKEDWQLPEELATDQECEPGELSDALSDLEPNDGNPLESEPLAYNPLNHAYPMMAETSIGNIEVMVKFALVRGKRSLPDDMVANAAELQVPVSTEDVAVAQSFDEKMNDQIARDIVSESALIDQMSYDSTYYLIPMIVRARRFVDGDPTLVPGEEGGPWAMLTPDETAHLISGAALLELIKGYADKVANDPDAPIALLDLLDHFHDHPNRANQSTDILGLVDGKIEGEDGSGWGTAEDEVDDGERWNWN